MSKSVSSSDTEKTEILESPKSENEDKSIDSNETQKTEVLYLSESPGVSAIMRKLDRRKTKMVERTPISKFRPNNSDGYENMTCKLKLFGNEESSLTPVIATEIDSELELLLVEGSALSSRRDHNSASTLSSSPSSSKTASKD